MKSKLLVLGASLMLILAGCVNSGGNDFVPDDGSGTVTSSGGETTVHVESVSLNHSSATLSIGDTLTLVQTVLPATATNKAVTWSATGDGVVSVDDGVVTALKAGSSTVTVTTVDGHRTATCEITVNATVVEETINPGEEGTKPADTFVYWADGNWCGSTVTVSEHKKVGNTLTFDYTVVDNCSYGFQIFYKKSSLVTGASYLLTAKINSRVAVADGLLKINGTYVTLNAGDNTIAIKYVEGGAQASSFQFVASTAIGANKFVISDLNWEGILDIPGSVAVNAAESKITFAPVDGAANYLVKYYDTSKNLLDSETVAASGATLTKIPTTNGNYYVTVTAISSLDSKYDSIASEYTLFKVGNDAIVPAAGPKANFGFGEEDKLDVDKFYYWADGGYWCGGLVTVAEGNAYTEEGLVNITYTAEGNCNFGLQVFYKNSELKNGTTYTVSFKLKSTAGGTVYPRETDNPVTIAANTWETISYEYTETAGKASLKLCVPTTLAASNTIQLKDFSWTAK